MPVALILACLLVYWIKRWQRGQVLSAALERIETGINQDKPWCTFRGWNLIRDLLLLPINFVQFLVLVALLLILSVVVCVKELFVWLFRLCCSKKRQRVKHDEDGSKRCASAALCCSSCLRQVAERCGLFNPDSGAFKLLAFISRRKKERINNKFETPRYRALTAAELERLLQIESIVKPVDEVGKLQRTYTQRELKRQESKLPEKGPREPLPMTLQDDFAAIYHPVAKPHVARWAVNRDDGDYGLYAGLNR